MVSLFLLLFAAEGGIITLEIGSVASQFLLLFAADEGGGGIVLEICSAVSQFLLLFAFDERGNIALEGQVCGITDPALILRGGTE